MNDSAYINVYHTINPSKFYSYGTYISKVCFGLVPGTTDEYSFISNPITGHFIYKVSSKYLMPSSNPQNESEARNCLAEILSNLRDKISAAKNSKSLPEDFPVLFNNSHISTMNIAPVYDGQNTNIITSWKAVLGIELKVFNSLKSAKSMLESDSIIIEFSGKRIIEMDYNYTPIVKREEVPIRPNENSEFILKKVNANTIAPYYLTADGYIPACSKSVPVLQKPVSFGWSSPQPTHDSCKSMLTWSDIVEPTEDHPGSAKLVISMDYKVVTAGEGAVKNLNLINPEEFSRLFKLGNFPGEKHKNFLLLKSLPTKKRRAIELKNRESRKITKGMAFYDYYKVNVNYEYKLHVEKNYLLWDGMKWLLENPYSRGIVVLIPFQEDMIKCKEANDLDTTYSRLFSFEIEDAHDAKKLAKENMLSNRMLYIIKSIINDNIELYKNANIYTNEENFIYSYEYIVNNCDFVSILSACNSRFYIEKQDGISGNWVELNYSEDFYNLLETIYIQIRSKIYDLLSEKVGGAGIPGHPNVIILNPYYFGTESIGKEFHYMDLSPSEIIAHEAGHNSAEIFSHSELDYKYYQTGLQSNEHGRIYPTKDNTIEIINDNLNRLKMTVI